MEAAADNSTGSRHKTTDDAAVPNTLLPKQFRCWSCTKKFQSYQSFLTHFADKHANFILSTPTDPTYILKNEIIKAKQQMKISSTEDAVPYNCSQDLKYLESEDTYGINFQSKHVESSSSNTTLTTNHINIETVATQCQKKATEHVIESINPQHYQASCAQTLESTTCPNVDFHEKKVEFNLYTNAKSSNTLSNQSTITKSQNDASEHARHCFKRFSCWKCFEKYKSAIGRLYHFISSHSELFLPTIIVSSKPMSKCTLLYGRAQR
jgi:hypothetical protein